MKEILLNDTQFIASSIYSHDTDDDYVKREYAPPNARLNNEINGGKRKVSLSAVYIFSTHIKMVSHYFRRMFFVFLNHF